MEEEELSIPVKVSNLYGKEDSELVYLLSEGEIKMFNTISNLNKQFKPATDINDLIKSFGVKAYALKTNKTKNKNYFTPPFEGIVITPYKEVNHKFLELFNDKDSRNMVIEDLSSQIHYLFNTYQTLLMDGNLSPDLKKNKSKHQITFMDQNEPFAKKLLLSSYNLSNKLEEQIIKKDTFPGGEIKANESSKPLGFIIDLKDNMPSYNCNLNRAFTSVYVALLNSNIEEKVIPRGFENP